jgi:predicted unusual protein kinase regulating ubiquinone biosynthesis (AarF/ABC1/UbiB family)
MAPPPAASYHPAAVAGRRSEPGNGSDSGAHGRDGGAQPGPTSASLPWTLTFVDFGMVGRVPDNLREGLREMVIGVGTRDARRVVAAYQRMDLLLPDVDLEMLERANARVFERYWGLNMTELTSVSFKEMQELTEEFRDLVYTMPFQAPQNIIFLARCVSILSGMCTGLDPNFNLWEHLAPYARKLIAEEARHSRDNLLGELEKLARTALSAPQKVDAILGKLERGDVAVRAPEVSRQVQRLETAQRATTKGVVFAALLVSGVQLYLAGEAVFAWTLLAGAGASLLSLLLGSRRK